MGRNEQSDTERHSEVLTRLHDIYKQKNALYGDSTTSTFKKFGMLSYAVRLNDKLKRLHSLVLDKDGIEGTNDESMVDTLLDMANYAVLAVMDLESSRPTQDELDKQYFNENY